MLYRDVQARKGHDGKRCEGNSIVMTEEMWKCVPKFAKMSNMIGTAIHMFFWYTT